MKQRNVHSVVTIRFKKPLKNEMLRKNMKRNGMLRKNMNRNINTCTEKELWFYHQYIHSNELETF